MIELDSGLKPRGFIWVSHASSEVLSENASVRVETQRVPISVPISVPRNGELSRDEARQKKFGLTPRELEILSALEARHSSKELAENFRISEDTMKHHPSNIYRKLDVGGSVWHKMIRFRASLSLVRHWRDGARHIPLAVLKVACCGQIVVANTVSSLPT
jgi:DNA-binding CsgD family transcriptional regulator